MSILLGRQARTGFVGTTESRYKIFPCVLLSNLELCPFLKMRDNHLRFKGLG